MSMLFTDIIYGPVHSRRLGISLGVNLLPLHSKLCNFDCIYCECGWNADNRSLQPRFNAREAIREALRATLLKMRGEGALPDVITFAGNGEPTLHPEFESIIEDTIALRDEYAPDAKISVLSNATQLHSEGVVRALRRVDNAILKIDSALERTAQQMNKPCGNYSVEAVEKSLRAFGGEFVLQTMFLRGEYDGERVDNTTSEEIEAWLRLVERLRPRQVMVYSIDRATPCKELEKVSHEELEDIAVRVRALGIACSAS
ncbi:MAG: radical SAM protein [Alistipes sp.]|nr:radical SAM protein [Alistipes sp.]